MLAWDLDYSRRPALCAERHGEVAVTACIEHLSGCLARFYAAALDPSVFEPALEYFARASGVSAASIIDAEPGGAKVMRANFGLSPDAVIAYNTDFHAMDRALPCLDGRPEIFSPSRSHARWPELRKSAFFNEWVLPNGILQIASISVDGPDAAQRSLLLTARPRDRFGDPEQIAFLGLMRPHIENINRIATQMRRAERHAKNFLEVLEHLTSGAILIDRQGRVSYASATAITLIREAKGLRLTSRGLRADDFSADRLLQATIANAIGVDRNDGRARRVGTSVCIPRSDVASPLVLNVLPLRGLHFERGHDGNDVLVLVADPERRAPRESDLLAAAFRLTRSEAIVALRVSEGLGLAAVAVELRVSVTTVRTHLMRVFEKTDTHRQAQLARLVDGVYATATF
jgi:DNA-binding CsgD family transcriptional regulator/PAS domain-containing protein